MLIGSFLNLHAAGCIQTGADVEPNEVKAEVRFGPMFTGLMGATHGDPCNGCPAYHHGKCKAFQQFNTRAVRSPSRSFVMPADRCRECGLKVRGPNHKDGWDHTHRAKKTAAA